jgi:tetratricopeptide (TPR) repeat protein
VAPADRTLRHLPFFEALAAGDEHDAQWRVTSAGLVTLRLVDGWLEEGPGAVAPDAWGLRAVRDAVDGLPTGSPIRSILTGIVDAMVAASAAAVGVVAPRLMAYGRALDFAGQWRLAADVFRTVVARTHPAEEPDLAIDANMQLGYCSRMSGELDDAAVAYHQAGRIAHRIGDMVKVLRSEVAEAKLVLERGNLPEAERMLDRTIAQARELDLPAVKALALHQRGGVAHARGQYELTIRFAYEALEGTTNPEARDHVLSDIAATFIDLGVRSAARDAFLVLAATAQTQYSRWLAIINLIEIAALDRCEPVFEQYRRELESAALPPFLEASYLLQVGEGHRTFGRVESARAAFTRAMEFSARHRLNQITFRAENGLRELEAGIAVAAVEAAEPSPAVQGVAAAMSEMRALAGVG